MMSLSTHGDTRRLGPACLCRRDELGCRVRDAGPGAVVSVLKGGAELTPEPRSEWTLVLQKVPSEANPKVHNHGEGPY